MQMLLPLFCFQAQALRDLDASIELDSRYTQVIAPVHENDVYMVR